MSSYLYPFPAIVGQEDLRLALVLNAVAPEIGGVLVRGQKGTAKSTAVRALARLLPDVAVVDGCAYACDPAAPDDACPAGPHNGEAARLRACSLVELPVGASTDRVAGTLDIEAALAGGRRSFQPGLLASAHRGLLYVDEVNLLADHLVDLLLDAAALGVNYVERDGVSVRHASRFLLVGTMNPEEGELRPQLLDRFGITVEVVASRDPGERAEVVRRRLDFDRDPAAFAARWVADEEALRHGIAAARDRLPAVVLPDGMLRRIAGVCAAFDVDGLRADIVCARAARALAAWEGRAVVELDDVRRSALLALPHRRRRGPFERPGIDPDMLDRLLNEDPDDWPPPGGGSGRTGAEDRTDQTPERAGAGGQGGRPPERAEAGQHGSDGGGGARPPDPGPEDGARPDGDGGTDPRATAGGSSPDRTGAGDRADGREAVLAPGAAFRPLVLEAAAGGAGRQGRRSRGTGSDGRGQPVDDAPSAEASGAISVVGTIRAAAPHQAGRGRSGPGLLLARGDVRRSVTEDREGNLVLFVVDASGSMAARRRMTAVKGAVVSLLLDAYQRRDRVGVVTFRGTGAEVSLPPTSSVDEAAVRLAELPVGGRTPLADGLLAAAGVIAAEAARDPGRVPLLVVVTDGRANAGGAGGDPVGDALRVASALAERGVAAVVVDSEEGPVRLGIAGRVAEALGGPCLRLEELASGPLARAVRATTARRPRRRRGAA
jgi:magnesium chelatase subunit D